MAFQQNFHETTAEFESREDVSLKQKWKSDPAPTTTASENSSGCCECNICLDSAREPVVTLCGHLYCWACIYKWLHVQSSSFESDKQPKCPVCKANISNSSLVPLYGRGNSSEPKAESKRPQVDPLIPSRPSALGTTISHPNQQIYPNLFQPLPQPFPHQQSLPHPFGNYASLATTNFGGTAMTSSFSPTVGMFGEMFCAMMFRSADAGLYAYPYGAYQNSYPAMGMGNGSPRMRRQVMQVEKSLNRLTIFFFCCFMLCLLLF